VINDHKESEGSQERTLKPDRTRIKNRVQTEAGRNRKPAHIEPPQPEITDGDDQKKLVPKLLPSKTEMKTKQTKRTKITTTPVPPKIIYIAVPVEAGPFRPSSPFNLNPGGTDPNYIPFGQVLGGPNQSFFAQPSTQLGSNPFAAYAAQQQNTTVSGQPSFSPNTTQQQTPLPNTNPFMHPTENIQI